MAPAMIYLDHNAGAPLRLVAKATMLAALDECGNASSVHAAGRGARARIESARAAVARLAGCAPASVVFTSGGTEANALALRGAVAGAASAGAPIARILVSAIEHDSVRANARALAEDMPCIALDEIPVTTDGVVDLDVLCQQLKEGRGRALVSIMAANNETGVVQPVETIAEIVRVDGGGNALLHIDAVQAAGRLTLAFDALGADYITLSAHKLGGPQGAGALILKESAPFAPVIAGGGQELRRRGGTENIAAIVGFGAAAEEAANFAAENTQLSALRERFEAELKMLAPNVVIFGVNALRLANTSNFAIPGLAAETTVIALDLADVAVSSGAACSSGKVGRSHVLAAMGVPDDLARGWLRVSLGWSTTARDIEAALAALKRLLDRKGARARAAA